MLEKNIHKESSEVDKEGTEVDPECMYGPSYKISEVRGKVVS